MTRHRPDREHLALVLALAAILTIAVVTILGVMRDPNAGAAPELRTVTPAAAVEVPQLGPPKATTVALEATPTTTATTAPPTVAAETEDRVLDRHASAPVSSTATAEETTTTTAQAYDPCRDDGIDCPPPDLTPPPDPSQPITCDNMPPDAPYMLECDADHWGTQPDEDPFDDRTPADPGTGETSEPQP